MDDISEEEFIEFAHCYVHSQVITNNEKLLYFYQDKNEVIIETSRNICVFRMSDNLYKFL